MMDIGEMLRECRQCRGMSQSELAERCNLSRSSVRSAEIRSNCTVNTLEKLLHAMGYELDIFPIEGWQK